MTVRNVFVVGPDKKVKLIMVYPMTTGRNFDEVLRVIDSLQLTAKHKVATPVNWQQGDNVIIAGSVSDDEAKKIYPDGWKSRGLICGSCPTPPAELRFAGLPACWAGRLIGIDRRGQVGKARIIAEPPAGQHCLSRAASSTARSCACRSVRPPVTAGGMTCLEH